MSDFIARRAMQCDASVCKGSIPCTICVFSKKLCRSCFFAFHQTCNSNGDNTRAKISNNDNDNDSKNDNSTNNDRSSNDDNKNKRARTNKTHDRMDNVRASLSTTELRWLEWAKVAPSHWIGFEENTHLPWPRTHTRPNSSVRYQRPKGKTVVFDKRSAATTRATPPATKAAPRAHSVTKPRVSAKQTYNQPYVEMEGTNTLLEHCMPLLPTEGPGHDAQWDEDLEALRERIQQPHDLPAHEYKGDPNLREFPLFALRRFHVYQFAWLEPSAEDWTEVWRDEAGSFEELLESFKQSNAVSKAVKVPNER